MRTLILAGILAFLASPALGQTVTSGSASGSASESSAGAVSGAASQSNPSNNQSINFNSAPVQERKTKKIRNNPDVIVPGVVATQGTCMGSVSIGGSALGFGVGGGATFVDADCQIRSAGLLLHQIGELAAAKQVLCQLAHVAVAFQATGAPCSEAPKVASGIYSDDRTVAALEMADRENGLIVAQGNEELPSAQQVSMILELAEREKLQPKEHR